MIKWLLGLFNNKCEHDERLYQIRLYRRDRKDIKKIHDCLAYVRMCKKCGLWIVGPHNERTVETRTWTSTSTQSEAFAQDGLILVDYMEVDDYVEKI